MAQGKEHKPTQELRDEVSALSSNGIPHEDIAEVLGIKYDCLKRHYGHELKTATMLKVKRAGNKLFELAMAGDITALIFFLKTRGRWRTEDSKVSTATNEEIDKEMKQLRADLDKKNRKEY
jgi:hypothetical protein